MDVREGFKQTEVGQIPDTWKVPKLGELTNVMTNGFVGKATSHYTENGNGILYIQGYNVEENSFNFNGIKFVTSDFHRKHLKSCLQEGDLLTVQTGEVGLTTIVPKKLEGSNCHALIISRFDKKRVYPKYMSFYLNSQPGRGRLRLIETGTTMKHLNVGDMLDFLVPLPPTLAEQQAIAEALSDADALIESLEQLIAKKRQIKQGAMQELLTGKRRLPGFEGEWERKPFGEIFRFSGGYSASRSQLSHRGYHYLHYGDIHLSSKSFVDLENEFSAIPRLECSLQEINPSSLLDDGDVVFVDASEDQEGVNKHWVVVNPGGLPFISGLHTIVAKERGDELDNLFKRYCFQSKDVKDQFFFYAVGTKVSGISKTNIAKIELSYPKKEEQSAIASILVSMDEEMSALAISLAKARLLKQGMMQELLTGRIRLV